MKNLFLLLIAFAFPIFSFAQADFRQGYIVNLKGDTLLGEVNFKGDIKNARECTFRANDKAEPINYKPGELKGYGFKNGKMYEAKAAQIVTMKFNLSDKFNEEIVSGQGEVNFMQILVKGKSSLYYLKDVNAETHYYLQKESEPLKQLFYLQANMIDPKTTNRYAYKSKLYVNILKVAFKDCPGIEPRIEKTSFKEASLTDLFYFYNKCIAPDQEIITQSKAKSKFSWSLLTGVGFSDMDINFGKHFLTHEEYVSKPGLSAGVSLDFTLPVLNEKLSINNSLYFTKRDYTLNYNYFNSDISKSTYHIAYKFNYLRLETCLRYTAPTKKIIPFGQFGISNDLLISGKEDITSTYYFLNYPPETGLKAKVLSNAFRNHQLGFVAGAGIKAGIFNKQSLILQTNYEFNTGFTKFTIGTTYSHNIAVLAGIEF